MRSVRYDHLLVSISTELALGGGALGEPLGVSAVVVDHELPLHPPHAAVAHVAELLVPPPAGAAPPAAGRRCDGLHCADGAALRAVRPDAGVGVEVAEGGDEGGLAPVRLDAAALRRPVVRVPQARVHPHRLALGERHATGLVVLEVPDRCPVHREYDVLWVPDDGVGVEGLGGVEPEAELLLALPLPLREHVGVQRVRLAGHVPQELEVDLIVGRTLRRQVEGGDGAGGVAGDELDLHVDLAEEVLALGLEPRAGAPVKREVEPTATIDDLAAALPPRHLRVLEEVASMRNGHQAGHRHNAKRHRPHRAITTHKNPKI
ncbi:hypothetical protein OsJ_22490 [Oryza sativa Japonica Group]|uniref:Uncharacterized protein n=1 Tax=Oryza sativa subsp. japonica TaxID=39947 RepID=B9FQP1_ORYSJ|nr:hypothetical protein OsJ_22490 [Oryza sativa Japonica Group]